MFLEIIKKISIFRSQKISSAALTVAVFGFLSRVIGLWRDRILAGQFGASQELDIYYAAFKIPDLVYNLLIVGAMSVAFLPIFYEYLTKDKNEAWKLASQMLNFLLIALAVLSLVSFAVAPQLISLVAPGFDSSARAMTVGLSRIMFISTFFLGISSLVTTLLQAFSRFLITSLAPVFYNLGIIFGAIYLVPRYGLWGLAYGVVLGAALHLLIQLPAFFHLDFKWRAVLNLRHDGMKKVIKLWAPRTLGLLAFQIGGIITTAIASGLASGSIAIFNLADNLRSVPIGIVGIAFSTAAFPAMSLAYARGDKELFLKRLSLSIRQTLFLIVPLTMLFYVLRAQIVRIVLGTGHFNWQDTRLTAAALGLFAFSIFASTLIPLFTRTFYVFHNTRTPVTRNIISMFINVILNFVFLYALIYVPFLANLLTNFLKVNNVLGVYVLALPLAATVTSIFDLAWLWAGLKKYLGDFGIPEIKKSFIKILIASVLSAGFAYLGLYIFASIFDTRTTIGLIMQAGGAAALGIIVYLVSAFLLKIDEMLMLNVIGTLFNWRGVKNPQPEPTGETLDDQY